jgi:hypothetical protein
MHGLRIANISAFSKSYFKKVKLVNTTKWTNVLYPYAFSPAQVWKSEDRPKNNCKKKAALLKIRIKSLEFL